VSADWRPSATLAALRQRAALLDETRRFFAERGVLEVETPIVSQRTVTDVQIASLQLATSPARYLLTSPEYPMKRLLAAGSGDIFQICKVFRSEERSRLHNPEFTMIEWYRLGFDLTQVMEETTTLAARLLALGNLPVRPVELLTYNDAFQRELDCSALTVTQDELAQRCKAQGLAQSSIAAATRDDLLDFLIATQIGPRLGQGSLTCLHHYPASQAALAQLDAADSRTALRFELYCDGVELANGYVELASSAEQAARFAVDREARKKRGLPDINADERVLAALENGLPACAGVAMGFDRVAMLALGAASIDAVMAFPWDLA
jgi:elongation factor P--(R)-beta-lysine ligase